MRCVECQDKPPGEPAHCECCGRPLPAAAPTLAAQCASCGGPVESGDLCPACHSAFQSVLQAMKPQASSRGAEPSAAAPVAPPPAMPEPRPVPATPATPPVATQNAPQAKTATVPLQLTRKHWLPIAAAIVLLAGGIGLPLAKSWLPAQEPQPAARVETPAEPVVVPVTPPEKPEPTPPIEQLAPAPPETEPLAPIEPVRLPRPAVRRETTTSPRSPIAEAPAPVRGTPPLPPPVAVPAAGPEDAPQAEAPFFELKQVSEGPQVASRVEPSVPVHLTGPLDDLVIVRVLVSQAGRPALVSVLRGSKAGVALDDAVVAAVKLWRFSPARKDGKAVSCWYYLGVPVTRGA